MLVERVMLKPNLRTKWKKKQNEKLELRKNLSFAYSLNSSRISVALSGWHTIVVRESEVNSWLMYFLPTDTMSSMVTSLIWRMLIWFRSVMRLVRRKHADMKFCNTTLSILFSRSMNSKINELFADSSKPASHTASDDNCASYKWSKLDLQRFIIHILCNELKLTVMVLNCLKAAFTLVARYKVKYNNCSCNRMNML